MELTCDICGGKLEEQSGASVCSGCGMEYSEESLKEKNNAVEVAAEDALTEEDDLTAEEDAAAKAAREDYRKFQKFWRYFSCICVIAFMGVLLAATPLQEAIVFGFCLAATIVDFVLYMPRKNKGGKKK